MKNINEIFLSNKLLLLSASLSAVASYFDFGSLPAPLRYSYMSSVAVCYLAYAITRFHQLSNQMIQQNAHEQAVEKEKLVNGFNFLFCGLTYCFTFNHFTSIAIAMLPQNYYSKYIALFTFNFINTFVLCESKRIRSFGAKKDFSEDFVNHSIISFESAAGASFVQMSIISFFSGSAYTATKSCVLILNQALGFKSKGCYCAIKLGATFLDHVDNSLNYLFDGKDCARIIYNVVNSIVSFLFSVGHVLHPS